MRYAWLLIDGFSLLYKDPALVALQEQGHLFAARQLLVRRLERAVGRLARKITVVYDGQGTGGPGEEFAASPVEVLFSPAGMSADAVIERMVRQAADPSAFTVVTNDRMERDSVDAAGARSISCRNFLELLDGPEGRAAPPATKRRPPHALGDYFPKPGKAP